VDEKSNALFLEYLNNSRDELRQLMERFNNRLTLEMSFAEKYIDGKITIRAYLEFPAPDKATGDGDVTRAADLGGQKCVLTAYHFDQFKRIGLDKADNRDDGVMFVHDVQIVEGNKGFIPSRLSIRPYGVNEHVNDGRPCSLYFSPVQRTYEFVALSVDLDLIMASDRAASPNDDRAVHKVDGGAQIVNRISENERQVLMQWLRLHAHPNGGLILINDHG
jgi:hypothetical protein